DRGAEPRHPGRLVAPSHEEGEGDLVVVAEIVVAVVDARDHEERAAGQQLDRLELGAGKESPSGSRRHEVGRGAGGGIADDDRKGYLASLDDVPVGTTRTPTSARVRDRRHGSGC